MAKTKIIGTIGPASNDLDTLRAMIVNGMDVVRLNMSHSDYAFCDDVIAKVQQLNEELDRNVAIMLDTNGPTVRLHTFQNGEVELKKDMTVYIHMEEIIGTEKEFSVDYPGLIHDVRHHDMIKLDDGRIELKVIDKDPSLLICKVITGGIIQDRKSLNVPQVRLKIPFLNTSDKAAILYAAHHDVDFLALSFVQSSEDVLEVNDLLIQENNDHLGIISKIENENAVDDIDALIKVSDGIMIARGDLGVELPFERVPGIQKMIINKCHHAGIVSIVATEMLSSMEQASRPTRAEVSDVANAVLDGVDAVMLSGETTIGNYPVETVMMMERIIASSEEDINYYALLETSMRTEKQDITGNIAYSVVDCANRLKCVAIVAPTVSGYTARKISRFRPSCPILAISPDLETVKSLALNFGVKAIYRKKLESIEAMSKIAKTSIENYLDYDQGKYILTGGYPFKESRHTNFMKIEEL